jgi:hypothetical protein
VIRRLVSWWRCGDPIYPPDSMWAGRLQLLLGEKGRWWVARRFLEPDRRVCWSSAVDWALAWDPGERTLRGCYGLQGCRESAAKEHGCYCGKVRPDGYVLKRNESVQDHPGEIDNCPCTGCRWQRERDEVQS